MRRLFSSPQAGNWIRLIRNFLLGQGMLQIVNAVVGFALIRWLSVEQFARYSTALNFQSIMVALSELGVMHAIVPLVGERADDPKVVGRYVRANRWFRTRTFLVASLAICIIFPFLTSRQPWAWWEKLILMGSIISVIWFRGWGIYQPVFVITRQMRQFYLPQIIGGIGRLAACFLLHIASAFNGLFAAILNALSTGYYTYRMYREGRKLIEEPEESDEATRKEILNYVTPLLPNVVFAAVSGQLAPLLVTYFGYTRSVAEVNALGRLMQLFTLLNTFNWVIIEPWFARQSVKRVPYLYMLVMGAMSVFIAFCIFLTWLFPRPVLWILGSHYRGLEHEVVIAVASVAIYQVAFTAWTLNQARRWTFSWYMISSIVVTVITQILCIVCYDMGTTHGALMMQFWTSCATLGINVCGSLWGLLRAPEGRGGHGGHGQTEPAEETVSPAP